MQSIQTVSVVGLGYIGLPTAATLANSGFDVLGVDVKADIIETINSGKIHISEQGLDILVRAAVHRGALKASLEPQVADAHIIAVPTPVKPDHSPDLSYVVSAAELVAKVLKPGDLVIVESTIPPGTCRDVVAPLLQERSGLEHLRDYHLAHCPERVIPGRILHEIIHNDRIIGGTTPEATERTAQLYGAFSKGKLLKTDATTAELCKLMENTYRDVNIALANELSGIAEGLGVDVDEAIALANHHPRVNLHTPGIGVGGHCIPVDPWFIVHAAPKTSALIQKARHINDKRTHDVAERLKGLIAQHEGRIALLGLSYKPDVDDLRESPAMDIALELAAAFPDIWIVEPHIQRLPEPLDKAGLELVPAARAFEEADLLIVLVAHTAFNALADGLKSQQTLIDARRALSLEPQALRH